VGVLPYYAQNNRINAGPTPAVASNMVQNPPGTTVPSYPTTAGPANVGPTNLPTGTTGDPRPQYTQPPPAVTQPPTGGTISGSITIPPPTDPNTTTAPVTPPVTPPVAAATVSPPPKPPPNLVLGQPMTPQRRILGSTPTYTSPGGH
jgi:hypothetical protein